MRHTIRRSRILRLQDLVPQAKQFFGNEAEIENTRCTGCTSVLEHVQPGDLFVGVDSPTGDSHNDAADAIQRGAVAVVTERLLPVSVPQVIVNDSREAYGFACQAFAGFPTREMPVIGVAGTLGKTTTALLVASVLNVEKQGVAAFTSLAHCDSINAVTAQQTTPPAHELAGYLAASVDNNCSHAVVELSSDALAERRAAGVELAVAVLTNLRGETAKHVSTTNDKLAKQRILGLLKPDGVAVLNADDAASQSLLARIEHPVLTFAMHSAADITATVIERSANEQTFFLEAGQDSVPVCTRILGDHHIYNCLAAAAVGLLYGLPLATIARGLEAVESIPGRMERLDCGQDFGFFIDGAASHDALAMCLKTARQVTTGRVICVMSPGVDPTQRPLLGRVLEKMATLAIITDDGPKSQHSLANAHDVLDGYQRPGKAHIIPSRDKAIRWAIETAQPGDTVVICGAGNREWKVGRKRTDDATFARQELYQLTAKTNRLKPIVYAFSG